MERFFENILKQLNPFQSEPVVVQRCKSCGQPSLILEGNPGSFTRPANRCLLGLCSGSKRTPPSAMIKAKKILVAADEDGVTTLSDYITNLHSRLEDMQKKVDEHQRDLYQVRGQLNIMERAQQHREEALQRLRRLPTI